MKCNRGYFACLGILLVLVIVTCANAHSTNKAAWTWERCSALASAGELPDRAVARHRQDAAGFRVLAEARARWPKLTMSTDLGMVDETYEGINPSRLRDAGLPEQVAELFERDPTDRLQIRAEVTMPVYRNREMRAQRDFRLAQLDEAVAARAQTETELRWELRELFIDVLCLQSMLKEQTAIQKERKQLLVAAESGYEAGLLSIGQVVLSRSLQTEAAATMSQTESLLALQMENLNAFLGLDPGHIPVLTGRLGCDPPPDNYASADSTLSRMPETEIARARERQVQAQVERLTYLPHRLEFLAQGQIIKDKYREDNVNWFVGLRLTMPLFDSGQRHQLWRAARSEEAMTYAGNESARRDFERRLRRSLLDYRHAWERKHIQADRLAASALSAAIAREEYSTGVGTLAAWQTAETDHSQQRLRTIERRRQAALAQAAWERLLGFTLEGQPADKGIEP